MSTKHQVVQGDCIESIAVLYGFSPGALWNHPENSELRALRESPNVLYPGDVVVIPEPRLKAYPIATGRRHIFRRKGVPSKLRLNLIVGDEPLAGRPYTLMVDGNRVVLTGVTTGSGELEQWIPADSKKARVVFEDVEIDVDLGYLDPSDTQSGVVHRLLNLGYLEDAEAPESDVEDALAAFQSNHGLPSTGKIDDPTRDLLEAQHRS